MLFSAHLCNHIRLQSGGGTWVTVLYTVRGVGSGSRDVDAWCANSCTSRIGGSKYRFRPIRVDHTNCLQVAIKTHSFDIPVTGSHADCRVDAHREHLTS